MQSNDIFHEKIFQILIQSVAIQIATIDKKVKNIGPLTSPQILHR
jgi:hypothetical protein